MKKILKTAAAALAGMLAIGLAACTDGNDEYNPEVQTTYYEADETYRGSGIAAKWDFSQDAWGLTNAEASFPAAGIDEATNGIKLADGSVPADAVLVPSGSWKKNTNVLQSKANTASLEKYEDAGGILKLTLKNQANIVVKGKGAGSAEPKRFIIIADKAGAKLAYKESLSSGKDVDFIVKGATAGEYTIYLNGASIYSIDLSAASDSLKKPAEITELKLFNKDGSAEAPVEISAFEEYETVEFAAYDVAGENSKENITADAVWTSSNEKVATVKGGIVTGTGVGTAVIRARVGRFYDERTVTVTKSTKTRATFFATANLPAEEKELGLDWTAVDVKAVADKLLKAVVGGNYVTVSNATIKFFDEKVSWSPKPTACVANPAGPFGKTPKEDDPDWSRTFGIKLKADKYDNSNFAQDFKFCEIKFTVTPTSSPVVINLGIAAFGGKNVNITPTIGGDSKTFVKVGKMTAITSLLAEGVTVSEETAITIAFSVADSGKNGVGFGFQDLVLSASLAE